MFIKKHIYEIYQLFVVLISLIAWLSSIYGIIIMCVGLIGSLLMKKFKYVMPWLLNFVFTINVNLSLNIKINPIFYIVFVVAILSLIVYSFLMWKKIKVGNSKLVLLLMAFITLLPIIWTKAIQNTHLLLYFSWFLYSLFYFVTIYSNDEDNKEVFSLSMVNLGLLIAFEVIITSIKYNGFNLDNILSNSLRVGWGIFNECGIMILVCIPYIFYFINTKKLPICNIIKLILLLIASFLTNSRGTYIFGLMLLLFMIGLLILLNKKNKIIYITISLISILLILFSVIFHSEINILINKIRQLVFYNGLSSNGRFELYNYGITKLISEPKFIIFGMGFVESYYIDFNHVSSMKDIFIVYHSTLIQTLSIGGIVGLIVFGWFCYKRYSLLIKGISDDLYKFILIGLIPIELYGLIDNTYHMFYYMIPLVISMGIFETSNKRKEEMLC